MGDHLCGYVIVCYHIKPAHLGIISDTLRILPIITLAVEMNIKHQSFEILPILSHLSLCSREYGCREMPAVCWLQNQLCGVYCPLEHLPLCHLFLDTARSLPSKWPHYWLI